MASEVPYFKRLCIIHYMDALFLQTLFMTRTKDQTSHRFFFILEDAEECGFYREEVRADLTTSVQGRKQTFHQ